MITSKKKRYTTFTIEKRAGGVPRVIDAPIKPIKDMQRQLAAYLAAAYEPLPNIHGFVAGRSPFSNARQHTNQEWLLKVDLEDFFPTIHFGRVRGMFMKFPFDYSIDVATVLAQICCHRGHAIFRPSSPCLARAASMNGTGLIFFESFRSSQALRNYRGRRRSRASPDRSSAGDRRTERIDHVLRRTNSEMREREREDLLEFL